jgi:hypothetical protein
MTYMCEVTPAGVPESNPADTNQHEVGVVGERERAGFWN